MIKNRAKHTCVWNQKVQMENDSGHERQNQADERGFYKIASQSGHHTHSFRTCQRCPALCSSEQQSAHCASTRQREVDQTKASSGFFGCGGKVAYIRRWGPSNRTKSFWRVSGMWPISQGLCSLAGGCSGLQNLRRTAIRN